MRERRLLSSLEDLIPLVDFVPVRHVPPGLQVLGPPIVVLEIVGVLPHVVAENRVEALADGIVLVGCGNDLNFALGVAGQPDPAAAELLYAGLIELRLETLKSPNVFEMASAICPLGSPPPFGFIICQNMVWLT